MSQFSKSQKKALQELRKKSDEETDWEPPAKPLPYAIKQTFDEESRDDIGFDDSYKENPLLLDSPVEDIPDRYRELKSDLMKLDNAGQLQQEVWLPHWTNLIHSAEDDSDSVIPGFYEQIHIGSELGELAELLMLEPDKPESIRASVTMGFLDQMLLGDVWRELKYLEQIKEHVDNLIEKKQKKFVEDIDEELPKELRRTSRQNIKKQGIKLDTAVKAHIDNAVDDFLEKHPPEEIKDSIERYVEQYDEIPETNPSFAETIDELADEHYNKKRKLRDELNRDVEALVETEVGGIAGIEVINNMPDEGVTIRYLSNEVTGDGMSSPSILKLCERLEDARLTGGEELRASPIRLGDRNKLHDRNVELTPYGKLLRESIAQNELGYRDPFPHVSEETVEEVI